MNRNNDNSHTAADRADGCSSRRDSLIAAGVTLLVALGVFLFLFWGEIGFDRSQSVQASIPETVPDEEEDELFLDPMLLDPGEEQSLMKDAAAAPAQGMPEVVPEPKQTRSVVKSEPTDQPRPAPPKEKLVASTKPSPVKAVPPKATDKEVKKAQSRTAGAFSPDNGQTHGRNNSDGSTGSSTGISGHSDGWKFLGCPRPDVKLRNKTVVTVTVTVNSRGEVTSASARGGTSQLRAVCEQAARKARWQPVDSRKARTARGTITFTITPR